MEPEAFLADPAFPQLAVASDPGAMREVFRAHLRPATPEPWRIEGCQVRRVRYRRGERCVLQYRLRLAEPATGREVDQWVTGVLYAGGRIAQLWRKLQAIPPKPLPAALRTFEPVALAPELDMLLQVFPQDRRLPTLAALFEAPGGELRAQFLRPFGPGEWTMEACVAELVRYRAELGAVLRYRVSARDRITGRREERRVYAKVYGNDQGERTARALETLAARQVDDPEGFAVGRPVAYLPALQTLLQEELPGTSLEACLLDGGDSTALLGRVARTLAAFNRSPISAPRRHTREDEVARVRQVGELLGWACPALAAEVAAIAGAVASGLDDASSGPSHRDLKLDHILVDGARLGLIDLDAFAEGDPLTDPASLLASLAALPFRTGIPRERAQAAARTFSAEYLAQVPADWRARLPLRYAGALLKAASGFFRRQEPGYPAAIEALVAEAAGVLSGKAESNRHAAAGLEPAPAAVHPVGDLLTGALQPAVP